MYMHKWKYAIISLRVGQLPVDKLLTPKSGV